MKAPPNEASHLVIHSGDRAPSSASATSSKPYKFKFSFRRLASFMGPGWVMSLAYLDPGNLEADLQQGAYTNMTLLWVLWWATCAGLLVQELSSRLAMVTGLDLAECSKRCYGRSTSIALYAMMELAIIGSDIQEVVGSAIAFQLLFGWPLWVGCLVTGLDSFTFLAVYQCGAGYFEALIAALVALIAGCFFANFFTTASLATVGEVAHGFAVPQMEPSGVVVAMGTLGAVIMPHNLYLHSGLVKTRAASDRAFNRADMNAVADASMYSAIESAIALLVSFFVNLAVVGTFAHFFFAQECSDTLGNACVPVKVDTDGDPNSRQCTNAAMPGIDARCAEIGLDGAGAALESTIGHFGKTMWAVGLLAAGQASTMSTTFAGQVVMDGFLSFRLHPWQRATVTRLAALGPSLAVAVLTSDHAPTRNAINEWLNILQSIQLPFAIIPVLTFTASGAVMNLGRAPSSGVRQEECGDRFKNHGFMLLLALGLTALVLGANVFLVHEFLVTHPSGGQAATIGASCLGLAYFAFVGHLAHTGVAYARGQLVPPPEDPASASAAAGPPPPGNPYREPPPPPGAPSSHPPRPTTSQHQRQQAQHRRLEPNDEEEGSNGFPRAVVVELPRTSAPSTTSSRPQVGAKPPPPGVRRGGYGALPTSTDQP